MPRNTYNSETVPRKFIVSSAIFLNEQEELLLIKSPYKGYWSLPGGIVEKSESPLEGCFREIQEEVGLAPQHLRLLVIDYKDKRPEHDQLIFVFFAGIVRTEEYKNITLAEDEVSEYRFVKPEEALPLLSEGLKKRIGPCLQALKESRVILLKEGAEQE